MCFELQGAEVEQEPLLGTLSAQEAQESEDHARKRGWGRGGYQKLCQHDSEEQLRHESAAASRASAPSKRIPTATAPADPAAAASSGAGSASAAAAEHMATQVDTIPIMCRCCKWACSGVAAAFVRECWYGHLARDDDMRVSFIGSLFSTNVHACLHWQLCSQGLHAAAFIGCTPILSSISMQLMQATPHQQIFSRVRKSVQFAALAGKHNIQSRIC